MMTPMSERSEFCTRCGCCAYVCPQGCIQVQSDGYPVRGEGCTECGLCEKVCPGTGVDLRKAAENLFVEGEYNRYIGMFRKTYTGCATDDLIREKATSGGVCTSLLVYLLEKGEIDGALVVSMDKEKPWKTTYVVATSKEEIVQSAQTKYQVTPLNVRLEALPLEKIAVVGLPCVIQGLRKIQEHSPPGRKIKLLIGLFCWVNMEREATEFLLHKLKSNLHDVERIEYRSGDYLGGFKIQLKNGKVKFLEKECYNMLPFLFAAERCLYCTDFTNELADISMGDAKFLKSKKGHTIVITRSEIGEKMLKDCEQSGYIHTGLCNVDTIIHSESSALLFKKGAYQRMQKRGITHYGEKYEIPLKNRVFALIFRGVHRNRTFFKKLLSIMPLSFFKVISRLITRERS